VTRNQIVMMDLKERKDGLFIMYLLDRFTRFMVAKIVRNKEEKTITEVVLKNWIAIFGVMDSNHKNVGKEFNNKLMTKVREYLGTRQTSTAAYSPHQNGACERNYAVIDRMMENIEFEDKSIEPEVTLCWAINAYNNLSNNKGFSPAQLVF
jgi:hypothetical protein